MPYKPNIKSLSTISVDVLNAIRNSATQNYKNYIPIATESTESIKAIGSIMMQYAPLQNEFLNLLVNRIGRVLITSRMYSNPWAFLKKGYLEMGETVEEIFVNLAKPHEYDVETAEDEVFKREIPDVRAAFHTMNYRKFYKATIEQNQLRQAFVSWNGVTDLIARIVDAMYTGANYDEFLTMKYLIARHALDGHIKPIEIPVPTAATGSQIVATVKGTSNVLEFLSSDYNLAGVSTYSKKDDQFLFVNAKFDALLDVEVLAAAFNLSKVEFMGHRVLVDSFGSLDSKRLAQLFAEDPTYRPITPAEAAALDAIPAFLLDRNFLFILDNEQQFTENYNGQGLYWNYWYHTWKTFSVSPFHNAVMFVPGQPEVSAVTVSPAAVTALPGQSVNFSADVTAANFAPQSVDWSTDQATPTIDNSGNLTIPADATGTITVTATSTFDPTKSGNAAVTVGAGG